MTSRTSQKSETLLACLNRQFCDILTHGNIVSAAASYPEAEDVPHLPRLRLWFDRTHYGRLRELINAINQD